MNRTDATNADDSARSREQIADEAPVHGDSRPTSWDPYEVWLTRIKEPRARAVALVAAAGSPNQAIDEAE